MELRRGDSARGEEGRERGGSDGGGIATEGRRGGRGGIEQAGGAGTFIWRMSLTCP